APSREHALAWSARSRPRSSARARARQPRPIEPQAAETPSRYFLCRRPAMMAPWNGIWQFRSRGPAQTSLVDKKAASAMRCIAAPTLTLPLARDGLGSPGLLQVFGALWRRRSRPGVAGVPADPGV